MKTIEQKVKEVIKTKNLSKSKNQTLKNFERAIDEFKSLVIQGIAEPRGNNLLSVEETHLNRSSFNVPTNSSK